jgi:hypothetical protein
VAVRVGAETWNSEPHEFNVPVTITNSFTKTPPATKTAAFTVDLTESKYFLNSTAGAFLVTLPNVSTSTVPSGQCWEFTLMTANGAVSFTPSAVGQLLDNSQAAYAGVDAVGDSATICTDGADYFFQSRYIH